MPNLFRHPTGYSHLTGSRLGCCIPGWCLPVWWDAEINSARRAAFLNVISLSALTPMLVSEQYGRFKYLTGLAQGLLIPGQE